MFKDQAIIFRCNAGREEGLGHFVRCLSLAEELQARGAAVMFLADFDSLEWPLDQLFQRMIPWRPIEDDGPDGILKAVDEQRAAAVIVDSYYPDEAYFREITDRGFLVAAIDDEAKRGLPVNLIVNQNFGAERLIYRTRPDTVQLLGAEYALLRRNILELRSTGARREFLAQAAKVLIVMGGTAPKNLAPHVLRALYATGLPLAIRALVADSDFGYALEAIPATEHVQLQTLLHVDDVAEHFLWSDLTVAAAGSTCWELACLQTPMALLFAFENQRVVYENMTAAGAALGLGTAEEATPETLAGPLKDLLGDAGRRAGLARQAATLIDGEGSRRVAEALGAAIAGLKSAAKN